jgi:hypothetical protein
MRAHHTPTDGLPSYDGDITTACSGGHAEHLRALAALPSSHSHEASGRRAASGRRSWPALTRRVHEKPTRLLLMLMLMLTAMLGHLYMYIIVCVAAALGARHAPAPPRPTTVPIAVCCSLSLVLSCPPPSVHLAACISAPLATTLARRLTDCVSTLWPWPSASALPTSADVLEIHPTSQTLATPVVCWSPPPLLLF